VDGEWYTTNCILQFPSANHLVGKLAGYEKLVTGRIRLDDIVEKGFKQLINNKDQHIKILVTPRKDISVGA
jgi:hypothetical protein